MLIKADRLENVIDNLVLFSSLNIIIIAKKSLYIQRVINYLIRVSPIKYEIVTIDTPDKLLYLYRCHNRFIGIVVADSSEAVEKLFEDYLVKSLTTYNYERNRVEIEKVKKALPLVVERLNAKYLLVDEISHDEIKAKDEAKK